MQLKMNHSPTNKMPTEGTIEEVIAAARKLFRKYHSTVRRTYGGGTQIEVLCNKDGYHGRSLRRVACYDIENN